MLHCNTGRWVEMERLYRETVQTKENGFKEGRTGAERVAYRE